ncbi:MAG: phage portal protein [Afipia sp.]
MLERIKSIFGLEAKNATATLKDYEQLAAIFGITSTISGAAVTPTTAMRCQPFGSGARLIAESIASLPVHVYDKLADGSKQRDADNIIHELLDDTPSEIESAFSFKSEMQLDCILHNDAFAYINRVNEKVRELVRLPSAAVTVDINPITMVPVYTYTRATGEQVKYSANEIFHLKGLGSHSPVYLAREAIGLALTLEKHAARLFGSGARPSGILKTTQVLGPGTIERLRNSFEAQHGNGQSGKTLILEQGFEFEPTQFNSVDAQFLEMRKHQIEEIARALRIPPHMIYEMGRATWSNSEQQGEDFKTYSLMGWIKRWEGEIRLKLLTAEERKTKTIEFNVDAFVRADLAARFEAFAKACGGPWMAPDEVRALDNRAPIEGGETLRPAANATGVTDPAKVEPKPKPKVVPVAA